MKATFDYRAKKIGILFSITVIFLYGCDLPTNKQEGQTNVQHESYSDPVEQSLTYFDNLPYSQLPQVKRMEKLQNDLADIHKGFGGLWVDPDEQGQLIIAVSEKHNDNNLNEELTASIEHRLLNSIPEGQDQNIQLRFSFTDAEFTFRDLQHFRDLLNPVIHQRNDIVESFIDIKNNIYSIGILENANKDEYQKLLQTYSIPTNAVKIYETGPVVTASASSSVGISKEKNVQGIQSNHTLRDRIRPIVSGIQIESDNNKTCTLGFTAKLDGFDVWVTTSTCSNHFSSSLIDTDTEFYNPSNSTINNQIGIEYQDFEGYTDASGNKYRFSDAVLVQLSASSDFARYAKTSGSYPPTLGWGNPSSLTIESTKTVFYEHEDFNPLITEALKIGRTTGTTGGDISSMCVDVSSNGSSQLPSGWTLKCQIRTDIYTRIEDWGAPLFGYSRYSSGPLFSRPDALLGITWGNNPTQEISYHSPVSAIKDELTNGSDELIVKCMIPLSC